MRRRASVLAVLVIAILVSMLGVASAEDVGLVDPGTGEWHLRHSDGTVNTFYFGNPSDYPFAGDWNCNGQDTPGLYRQSDGFVYLRNSNTQGIADIRFFFGNPGDVPIAGDFNGDGCDSVSIYRPSEQRFYIVNKLGSNDGGLGAAEFSFIFGNPGDKPFVGDFDGDQIDEIGLHRESTGFVYFRNTLTTGIADNQFFFGNPGDRLLAGDWGTSDGTDTPAVFRPSEAKFYFRYSNTQGIADETLSFGESTSLPVGGNWLGAPPPPPPPPPPSPEPPPEGAAALASPESDTGGNLSPLSVPYSGTPGEFTGGVISCPVVIIDGQGSLVVDIPAVTAASSQSQYVAWTAAAYRWNGSEWVRYTNWTPWAWALTDPSAFGGTAITFYEYPPSLARVSARGWTVPSGNYWAVFNWAYFYANSEVGDGYAWDWSRTGVFSNSSYFCSP